MAQFTVQVVVSQVYEIPVTAEDVDQAVEAAAIADLSQFTPLAGKSISVVEEAAS